MKRLRATLTLLSALLLAAAIGMGVRSRWVNDALERRDIVLEYKTEMGLLHDLGELERHLTVASWRGRLTFTQTKSPPQRTRDARTFGSWSSTDADSLDGASYAGPNPRHLGFIVRSEQNPHPAVIVAVPYWFLVLCFAIAPLAYLLRRLRGHAAGHCHKCGYDLRATKDRCPECGTPVPPTVAESVLPESL